MNIPRPPYRISICGKDEIDAFATQGVTHLLSIEDPGTPKTTPTWFQGAHLQIHLHDIDTPAQALDEAGVLPDASHVEAILAVGEECREAALAPGAPGPVHLLVHCFAGISRSTAAAFVLTVQSIGVERASEALALVLSVRPQANPNPRLVREADRLLKARGRLISALRPHRERLAAELDAWLAQITGRSKPADPTPAPDPAGPDVAPVSTAGRRRPSRPSRPKRKPATGQKNVGKPPGRSRRRDSSSSS